MNINDLILLENVRLYSERMIKNYIQHQKKKTFIVKSLSAWIDNFVITFFILKTGDIYKMSLWIKSN